MQNVRSKLKGPTPGAMPCRTGREEHRETSSVLNDCETKNACIVEADESTRKRMAGTLHEGHEDHIAGKGINSLGHCNLVHKFMPMHVKNLKRYRHGSALRSDIVKDDSGSYAVFTEQGSSASQMPAAKVMEIISRLPTMRRTSSRRSIRSHPGQNGRCSIVAENSKVRMSMYLDTSTETQMAKTMVQHGRPSCSSWTESVRSSFGRTVVRKAI